MKNIQTSVVVEENWVEAHTSKLQSLPTATSALELDVSNQFSIIFINTYVPFQDFPISLLLSTQVLCVLWSHYPLFYFDLLYMCCIPFILLKALYQRKKLGSIVSCRYEKFSSHVNNFKILSNNLNSIRD